MKTTTLVSLASLTSLLAAASAVSAASPNGEGLEAFVGTLTMGAQGISQANDFGAEQLLSGGGFAVGGAYTNAESDEDTNRRYDADFETSSISLGYVHEFDGFNLGISISAVDSEFESTGSDNNGDLDSKGDGWIVSIGASKQWDKLEVIALAGAGELSFDSTRLTDLGVSQESDYDSSLFFFSVKALYEVYQSDSFEVRPFLEVGYVSIENDGFTETRAPDFSVGDDYEDKTPYAELGLNFQYVGSETFHPYLNLSVWQDLGDDEVDLEGTGPTGAAFQDEVPDVAQTVFTAELGFSVEVTDSLDLGANLGFFSGDELSGYNAGLSAVFSF